MTASNRDEGSKLAEDIIYNEVDLTLTGSYFVVESDLESGMSILMERRLAS